jgi:hypothetical protein
LPQSLPLRPVALALACAVLAVVVASCGGGSGSGSGSSSTGAANTQAGQQRRGFGALASDPKVKACLQKQGVTLPARPNRPPSGGGTPPAGGAPPAGGRRPGQNPAQFQKLRQALKTCGVTLPAPGQGGPAGPPPAGGSQPQTTS